jgi:hypothetical protein
VKSIRSLLYWRIQFWVGYALMAVGVLAILGTYLSLERKRGAGGASEEVLEINQKIEDYKAAIADSGFTDQQMKMLVRAQRPIIIQAHLNQVWFLHIVLGWLGLSVGTVGAGTLLWSKFKLLETEIEK